MCRVRALLTCKGSEGIWTTEKMKVVGILRLSSDVYIPSKLILRSVIIIVILTAYSTSRNHLAKQNNTFVSRSSPDDESLHKSTRLRRASVNMGCKTFQAAHKLWLRCLDWEREG